MLFRSPGLNGEEMSFNVYIHGKESNPDTYKIATYVCQPEESSPIEEGYPTSLRMIELNLKTKEYIVEEYNYQQVNGGDCDSSPDLPKCKNVGTNRIVSKLKIENGKLVFDPNETRTIDQRRVSSDFREGTLFTTKERHLGSFEFIKNRDIFNQKTARVRDDVSETRGFEFQEVSGEFYGRNLADFTTGNINLTTKPYIIGYGDNINTPKIGRASCRERVLRLV